MFINRKIVIHNQLVIMHKKSTYCVYILTKFVEV